MCVCVCVRARVRARVCARTHARVCSNSQPVLYLSHIKCPRFSTQLVMGRHVFISLTCSRGR